MIKKLKIKEHFVCNKKNVVLWIFSVIASILFVLTKSIYHIAKSGGDSVPNLPLKIFSIENLIFFLLSIIIIKYLSTWAYNKISSRRRTNQKKFKSGKKVFWVTFVSALFVWGVCFLTFFPGLSMTDTIYGAMDFVNTGLFPPFFLAVVYFFVNILGGLFGSFTIGFGMLSAVQIIAEAFITAFFIHWLYQKRVSKIFIYLSGIFLICFPILICYANTLIKDSWFAFSFLLLLPNLYDFIFANKKSRLTAFLLFLSLVLIALSRSNGIIIVAITLIILFIVKIKNSKKTLVLITAGVLLLFSGFSLLPKIRNVPSVSLRESLSIPLDQVSATFYYNGDMSDDERSFFTQILPEQKWKDNFRFSFIDIVKFDNAFNEPFLNDHKMEFFSNWSSIVMKNPKLTTEAALYQTFGVWNTSFWDPTLYRGDQSTFYNLLSNVNEDNQKDPTKIWIQNNDVHNVRIIPSDLYAIATGFYSWAFEASMFLAPGLIVLFMLLICCYLIINKTYKIMIVFVPLILGWGSMLIATPASLIYRYYSFLLLALPFLFYILLYKLKKKS